MILHAPKDSFTCRGKPAGFPKDHEKFSSLTKLIHLPGKLAGVGYFIPPCSRQRQLKPAGSNAGYSEVFIELLPAQRETVEFKRHFLATARWWPFEGS